MHIPQKGKKMIQNGKKCQKITNNCKISEITKYGEQITKIDKNVKQCKKMPKFRKFCFHRFSGSKLPQKMVLAVFTRCLVPEIHIFGHFLLKSAFLGLNFS